jgi:hypothetical protein
MRQKNLLLILLVCTVGLYAEESEETIKTATRFTLSVSSLPEAKMGIAQTWTLPFLQGESFLTQDNNLSATLGAEISPISLNGTAEIIWTPVAFFQAVTGGRVGTGWNISLFGSDIIGIGINKRKLDGSVEVDAMPGLLWSVKAGGALQFDLAAIFPGDWNHVVFRTYHEINYAGYSAASVSDPWYFEGEDGEKQNGFSYYGNFLLGYQPPLFLNTVAFLTEIPLYLYDTPAPELWGGDLPRWIFSLLLNFTITKRISIAGICQFRTQRTWTSDTQDKPFYRDRRLADSPLHLEFYRVAAILNVSLF